MVNKIVKIKCCRTTKNFKLTNLWVSHHITPSDFYASAWQPGDSPIPLLVIRLLALLLAASILTWAVYEGCNLYWLTFLTNWGLMLVTAMFLNGVIVSIAATCRKIPDEGALPWYVSSYWFVQNMAVSMSLLITLLYWVLLYSPEAKEVLGTRLFVLDMMTHGVNSILIMIELLLSRTPVKILHIYQPLGIGLWYAAFTGIYYLAGGTDGRGNPYIYEILDWRNTAQSAIIVGISTAALMIIYCLVYGIAFCRDLLTNALIRTTTVKLSYVPPDLV